MCETEIYLFYKHQFGQWTLRDMVDIDGTIYNCCEQYMMAKKAQLFGDQAKQAEIMNESSPKQQQALGRKVKGFNRKTWDNHKFAIVWFGNYLKFSQHKELRTQLTNTGDKILAEASPDDLVWGIGFHEQDDDALDPGKWSGQNLLGKVLMSVREALRVFSRPGHTN